MFFSKFFAPPATIEDVLTALNAKRTELSSKLGELNTKTGRESLANTVQNELTKTHKLKADIQKKHDALDAILKILDENGTGVLKQSSLNLNKFNEEFAKLFDPALSIQQGLLKLTETEKLLDTLKAMINALPADKLTPSTDATKSYRTHSFENPLPKDLPKDGLVLALHTLHRQLNAYENEGTKRATATAATTPRQSVYTSPEARNDKKKCIEHLVEKIKALESLSTLSIDNKKNPLRLFMVVVLWEKENNALIESSSTLRSLTYTLKEELLSLALENQKITTLDKKHFLVDMNAMPNEKEEAYRSTLELLPPKFNSSQENDYTLIKNIFSESQNQERNMI